MNSCRSCDGDLATPCIPGRCECECHDKKRIYVVVADAIETRNGLVRQPLGRQVAQAVHVGRLVQNSISSLKIKALKKVDRDYAMVAALGSDIFTTIVLSARDSQELTHLSLLLKAEEIPYRVFGDKNPEAYGDPGEYATAIATLPVEPVDVQGIIDYLPLWGSDRHLKAM